MTSHFRYQLLQAVKIAAFLLSCFFVWYHIEKRVSVLKDFDRLTQTLNDKNVLLLFLLVIVLMIFNWTLESLKWKMLIEKTEHISLIKSIRSVLTGLSISFCTPNRVGEFAGKILHLKPHNRVAGALTAFVGSTAQLLITIQLGCLSIVFLQRSIVGLNNPFSYTINVFIILFVAIITLGWFTIPFLTSFFHRIKLTPKFIKYVNVFKQFHWKELIVTYLLSLVRYIVFASQQFILLRAFNVYVDYSTCFQLTAISFLLITAIPSISFGELGIRGGVNIAVFGILTNDVSAILICTFTLWLINLALPSLLGAISMLYIRINKN